MQRTGSAIVSVRAQSLEGGGRGAVGLNEEMEHCVLYEMKSQLDEMQDNWLIWCVEEKKGVGFGLGCGLSEGNIKGTSGCHVQMS